jgi:NAD(P)-dependent dehydrogenase (short-subunit alcohol dehydrogenase family)
VSNAGAASKFGALQRLDGKIVLVTGASGILGRRFCAGYAELGASVVLVDLDAAALAAQAEDLRAQYRAKLLPIACDLTDAAAIADCVAQATATLGGLHVLHNNAATKGSDVRAFFAPFEEYSAATWREVMAVNIDAMFLMAQQVGRYMIAQGAGGSVIQTSSIYGLVAPDQRIYAGSHYLGGPINTPAVYSASKAAVVGLTKYLAAYWAGHRIRVNCLVPGGVESGQNTEFSERYSARVPLGRMARADEIVPAALFLASDASSYVTGQVLAVDGGWTAW